MAKSIGKKLKGLFMGNKIDNSSKYRIDDAPAADADTGSVNADTGFEVLNDAPKPDAGIFDDVLGGLDAPKEETIVEPPMVSDDIPEKTEEIEPESEKIEPESKKIELKTEKTHEKVARIAAEMNAKGYGL